MENILYIVVPCYNEEEVIRETAEILKKKLESLIVKKKISTKSKILFVNDGSYDKTWDIIKELNIKSNIFTGIKLSKNEGHQNALLAGLLSVKERCDMAISIDADLQDDVNAIDDMVDRYINGFDIVYGVRKDRKKDSFFKKKSAEAFYKIMNILGAKTIYNHADFRLMSKRALYSLEQFKEVNLFLRGIIPMIGFKYCSVYYSRKERKAGVSKYPLPKMLTFAMNGITSCSVKLMHIIFLTGIFSIILSVVMTIYCLLSLINSKTVSGWTSLMTSIWAIGGMVLVSLGIIGEYIGKIYMETKRRPRFVVSEVLGSSSNKNLKAN